MQLLFMKDDQLGKDTLGRNLHDWLLDTGKPLLDAVLAKLNTQHTLVMDETVLPVLQSKGQGVCEAPESEKPRQKNYISVQCVSTLCTWFSRETPNKKRPPRRSFSLRQSQWATA